MKDVTEKETESEHENDDRVNHHPKLADVVVVPAVPPMLYRVAHGSSLVDYVENRNAVLLRDTPVVLPDEMTFWMEEEAVS